LEPGATTQVALADLEPDRDRRGEGKNSLDVRGGEGRDLRGVSRGKTEGAGVNTGSVPGQFGPRSGNG